MLGSTVNDHKRMFKQNEALYLLIRDLKQDVKELKNEVKKLQKPESEQLSKTVMEVGFCKCQYILLVSVY